VATAEDLYLGGHNRKYILGRPQAQKARVTLPFIHILRC